jgi:hypothetical protein
MLLAQWKSQYLVLIVYWHLPDVGTKIVAEGRAGE